METKRWKLLLFILFLFMNISTSYSEEEMVEVSAINLIYIPEESKVLGEGDVFIRHKGFEVQADEATYLVERGEILAKSLLGKQVRVSYNGYVLYGKELYYNIFEKRGFMIKIESEKSGISFKGERVDFYLTDRVPPRKLLFFKSSSKGLEKPSFEVSINKGSFTACKLYKPSYYLSGSKIILYPDGTVSVIKPALHLGGTKVLTLPFDYSFNIKEKKYFLITPVIGFTSTLGWYGGIAFENSSDVFPFSIALLYSEDQGFVGRTRGSVRLSKEAWFLFDIERSEDWEDGKLNWRTELRFAGRRDNLDLSLAYIKDKKYWVLRDGEDVKTIYSAIPEVYAKYYFGPLLFFARWGSYEEKNVNQSKFTLGGSLTLEKSFEKNLLFNLELIYLKDYYENDLEREISYYRGVLKWNSSKISVLMGYLERKVFGETPFYFDSYDSMRKYFLGAEYLLPSFSLKSYFYYDDLKGNMRDWIGEISMSLGNRAFFSIKPWYYLDEGSWREIDYNIIYYLCPCGCTSIELGFHDDLRKENDDVLWLRLYISPTTFSFVSGGLPEEDSLIPR